MFRVHVRSRIAPGPGTKNLWVSSSAESHAQNGLERQFWACLSRSGLTYAHLLESARVRQAPLTQIGARPYLVGPTEKLTPSVSVQCRLESYATVYRIVYQVTDSVASTASAGHDGRRP